MMQKCLAERFLHALRKSDHFTIREIFASLGRPSDHQTWMLKFGDNSLAFNKWYREGDELQVELSFMIDGTINSEKVIFEKE